MTSTLPKWLRITWLCLIPFALLFATRMAWMTTLMSVLEGPEIIGFSLLIAGLLCSLGLALWLAVATIFMIKDRKAIAKADAAMIGFCLFVLVSLLIPQWPFS